MNVVQNSSDIRIDEYNKVI